MQTFTLIVWHYITGSYCFYWRASRIGLTCADWATVNLLTWSPLMKTTLKILMSPQKILNHRFNLVVSFTSCFGLLCAEGPVGSSGWDVQADWRHCLPLQQGGYATRWPVQDPAGPHWHWERGEMWVMQTLSSKSSFITRHNNVLCSPVYK